MKKFFSVVILGCFLGAMIAVINPNPKEAGQINRTPSSQVLIGKHQRLFDIQIKALRPIPKDETQELPLRATVRLLQDINAEVHYRWVLPEQSHVIEGEATDSIVGLKAPNAFSRVITLDGLSSEGEPQVVVLQVYAVVGGVNIGSAGVFSTQPSEVQFSDPAPTPKDNPEQKVDSVQNENRLPKDLPRSIQQ